VGIYKDFQSNRIAEAQEKQFRINRFIDILLESGYLVFAKYTMKYRGFDVGHCRRPFKPFTKEQEKSFDKILQEEHARLVQLISEAQGNGTADQLYLKYNPRTTDHHKFPEQ